MAVLRCGYEKGRFLKEKTWMLLKKSKKCFFQCMYTIAGLKNGPVYIGGSRGDCGDAQRLQKGKLELGTSRRCAVMGHNQPRLELEAISFREEAIT